MQPTSQFVAQERDSNNAAKVLNQGKMFVSDATNLAEEGIHLSDVSPLPGLMRSVVTRAKVLRSLTSCGRVDPARKGLAGAGVAPPAESSYYKYCGELDEWVLSTLREHEADMIRQLLMMPGAFTLSVDGAYSATANLQSHQVVATVYAHFKVGAPQLVTVAFVQRESNRSDVQHISELVQASARC